MSKDMWQHCDSILFKVKHQHMTNPIISQTLSGTLRVPGWEGQKISWHNFFTNPLQLCAWDFMPTRVTTNFFSVSFNLFSKKSSSSIFISSRRGDLRVEKFFHPKKFDLISCLARRTFLSLSLSLRHFRRSISGWALSNQNFSVFPPRFLPIH